MADLKTLIEANNDKFMACFNANDMKGLANLYTEDCKVMPTGMQTLHGRQGPEKVFQGAWDSGVREAQLIVEECGPMGSDLIYERSTYVMKAGDGSVADTGKYVVIWKKVDGSWFLHIDIFNTNKARL